MWALRSISGREKQDLHSLVRRQQQPMKHTPGEKPGNRPWRRRDGEAEGPPAAWGRGGSHRNLCQPGDKERLLGQGKPCPLPALSHQVPRDQTRPEAHPHQPPCRGRENQQHDDQASPLPALSSAPHPRQALLPVSQANGKAETGGKTGSVGFTPRCEAFPAALCCGFSKPQFLDT